MARSKKGKIQSRDIGGLKYDILLISDAAGAGHHYEIQLERVA
jgi:hypothetical protein